MTNDEIMDLVTEALAIYSESTRRDVGGIAYLKAAELSEDTSREIAIKRIRNRIDYEVRKDCPEGQEPEAGIDVEDRRGANSEQDTEVKELLANLDPQDATIVSMLIAGNTRSATAQAIGISRNTLANRLKRLQHRLTRGAGGRE